MHNLIVQCVQNKNHSVLKTLFYLLYICMYMLHISICILLSLSVSQINRFFVTKQKCQIKFKTPKENQFSQLRSPSLFSLLLFLVNI